MMIKKLSVSLVLTICLIFSSFSAAFASEDPAIFKEGTTVETLADGTIITTETKLIDVEDPMAYIEDIVSRDDKAFIKATRSNDGISTLNATNLYGDKCVKDPAGTSANGCISAQGTISINTLDAVLNLRTIGTAVSRPTGASDFTVYTETTWTNYGITAGNGQAVIVTQTIKSSEKSGPSASVDYSFNKIQGGFMTMSTVHVIANIKFTDKNGVLHSWEPTLTPSEL